MTALHIYNSANPASATYFSDTVNQVGKSVIPDCGTP